MTLAAIHDLVQAAYRQRGGKGDCGAVRLRGRDMEHDDTTLNKLAHEALGRGCWHEVEWKKLITGPTVTVAPACKSGCQIFSAFTDQPNYAESLDAVKPLEELAVERVGYLRYMSHLINENGASRYALAPARTRLLAALKVLGKI